MMENFKKLKEDITFNREISRIEENFEDDWDVYDSSLSSVGKSFFKTLPEKYITKLEDGVNLEEYGKAFKKYIEDKLDEKDDRFAIEFGGPGSNFFRGFDNNFFKKTVGVCLKDIRFNEEKEDDNKINHFILTGDILDTKNQKLFNDISEKLENKKVDLIISRLMGPLDEIRKSPILMEHIIRKWFSLLSNKGILFAQFEYYSEHDSEISPQILPPPKITFTEIEIAVKEWVDKIINIYPNQIDIQLGRGVIRITKKENSPEELPRL